MMFPKNHILRMKGLVPEDECKKIIYYFESHQELHCDGLVGGRLNYEKKKDTEIGCDFLKSQGPHWISKYLNVALKEYHQQYPESDEPTIVRYDKYRYFKLQKYFPSEGYFVNHCENDNLDNCNRVLAWMIYLNDVTDGGYTEFPNQKKKYQPRVGDVLLWPAYFTHTHRGIVSKSQIKYIVTGWFTF